MVARRTPRTAADIPVAARLILEDYLNFVAGGAGMDDAEIAAFTKRHAAGRGGLAHFEHLMKVAGERIDPAELQSILQTLTQWRALMPSPSQEETDADGRHDRGDA